MHPAGHNHKGRAAIDDGVVGETLFIFRQITQHFRFGFVVTARQHIFDKPGFRFLIFARVFQRF